MPVSTMSTLSGATACGDVAVAVPPAGTTTRAAVFSIVHADEPGVVRRQVVKETLTVSPNSAVFVIWQLAPGR